MFWQPEIALQESCVHAFPSLQAKGVPATHAFDTQVSTPSQTLLLLQSLLLKQQPGTGVPAWHVVPTHVSTPSHGLPLLQSPLLLQQLGIGVPGWQTPLEQSSLPLHVMPSGQGVLFGKTLAWQSPMGLHVFGKSHCVLV